MNMGFIISMVIVSGLCIAGNLLIWRAIERDKPLQAYLENKLKTGECNES